MTSIEEIIVAPDKFKGTYTAVEMAELMAGVCRQRFPGVPLRCFPMADGGEGSMAAIAAYPGRWLAFPAHDPLMRPISASLFLLDASALFADPVCALPEKAGKMTAVIEMAATSGLQTLSEEDRNPLHTTSYGFGEAIAAAWKAGADDFLLCIGGSATHDGGAGLLQALGYEFYTAAGKLIPKGISGGSLALVAGVDGSGGLPFKGRAGLRFRVACDVGNPLLGPSGAACVFAPQKGAAASEVPVLEQATSHFYELVSDAPYKHRPGEGAAGGMGWCLQTFLGAELLPGARLIADAIGLTRAMRGKKLLVTGEGCLDAGSLQGKVPVTLCRMAQASGMQAILVCGTNKLSPEQMAAANLPPCELLENFVASQGNPV